MTPYFIDKSVELLKQIPKESSDLIFADVLDYIHSVNCHYKFNELPLSWLGLPK
jgi:hypothetical protein